MDNMTIFDFIEGGHRFAPVIDELSADLSRVFSNKDYEEQYKIWDHVPYLGYRYSFNVSIGISDFDTVAIKLKEVEDKYSKYSLEVSVLQTPCFKTKDNISLFISTLWEDKKRAKDG
jgi:hypothetical protein